MATQLFWLSSPLLAAAADRGLPAAGPVAGGSSLDAVALDFPCLICRQGSERLFEVSDYWIRQCGSCGHRFAELVSAQDHVARQYGDQYFTGGDAGYSDYLGEERLLISRGRWYANCIANYCQPGSVCDVGAAAGFTLLGFREAGWTAHGVEPNPRMAQYARQRFDLHVETGSFEDWQTESTFDLVTMLQVLPHFIEPAKAISKASRLVRPGGHLLIETWDRSSWTARLFGRHWHEYSPPSVLHWFSRSGVVQLAAMAGFEQVATGRPSKWIDAAHAKSVLKHKAGSSIANRLAWHAARLIPDRVAIPYIAEDLFWILLRRVDNRLIPP
jgi:SAM-dependent methyltransferase